MTALIDIRIMDTAFDPVEQQARFVEAMGYPGGVVSFTGHVRSGSTGAKVRLLQLTHYAEMTVPRIQTMAAKAAERWPLQGLLVIHRVGDMRVGKPIVLVCAASPHRRAAFEACDHAMDYLKTEAVFWKKEITETGEHWIEPRTEDYEDSNRWSATVSLL